MRVKKNKGKRKGESVKNRDKREKVCMRERKKRSERDREPCFTFVRCTDSSCNLLQHQSPLVTVSPGRPSLAGTRSGMGGRVCECVRTRVLIVCKGAPPTSLPLYSFGWRFFFPPIMSTAPIVSRYDCALR